MEKRNSAASFNATPQEREDLINREIIPYAYRSRQIALVRISSADVATAIATVVKIDRLRAAGESSYIAPRFVPRHDQNSNIAVADIVGRVTYGHRR